MNSGNDMKEHLEQRKCSEENAPFGKPGDGGGGVAPVRVSTAVQLVYVVLLSTLLTTGSLWMKWKPAMCVRKATVDSETTTTPPFAAALLAPSAISCWTGEDVCFHLPLSTSSRLKWERRGFDSAEFTLYRGDTGKKILAVPVGRTISLRKVAGGKKLAGRYTCVLRFSDKRESESLPIFIRKTPGSSWGARVKHSLYATRTASGVIVFGTGKTYQLPLRGADTIQWTRPGYKHVQIEVEDPFENRRKLTDSRGEIAISRLVGNPPIPGRYKIFLIFDNGTTIRTFKISR